ncbi:hypothetical protein D9615_003120 [Tricholomella constricta]|uniref:Uncharacterized protein n=1 Tax=Tricholomella constricta TaxID=117010 RepID=A0A8H5M831_9AGAR|nr:hypothetical protein D9615_003120 [Tricholomella constricta]
MVPHGDAGFTVCAPEDASSFQDANSVFVDFHNPLGPSSSPRTASLERRLSPPRTNERLCPVDRRPKRSSPLAGPAFSNPSVINFQADNDSRQAEELSPIYISPPNPPPRTYSPKKAVKGLVRFSATPPLELFHTPLDTSFLPSKRSSLRKPHDSPSSAPPDAPLPPTPAKDLLELPYRGRSYLASSQPTASTSTLRPIINRPARDSDVTPSLINTRRASISVSKDPAKNWMTTNTYETTPRFSRLGISASTVVLPVSAREYKRVATKKKASPKPIPSGVGGSRTSKFVSRPVSSNVCPSPHTLPLSLSSHASVADSISSSCDVGTVVEDSEEEEEEEEEITKKNEHPFIEVIPPGSMRELGIPYVSPSLGYSRSSESVVKPHGVVLGANADAKPEMARGSRGCVAVEVVLEPQELGAVPQGGDRHLKMRRERGRERAVTRWWRKLAGGGRRGFIVLC